MTYGLGIDIGTGFTAAAIAGVPDDGPILPQALTLGRRGAAVPTIVHVGDDGVAIGESAERRGIDDPGRVVRDLKRRIGDDVPIVLDGQEARAEELYALVAQWVVERAAEREGEHPAAVTLTHPASWGGHRLARVRDALTAVGLGDARLLSEPEAAALHYATRASVAPGAVVAVYDLGAGTFDATVLRRAEDGTFALVGRPTGVDRLGGADFDEAVLAHVRDHAADLLANADVHDPATLRALARLHRECVEAKEALSYDTAASIPVLLPGAQTTVRLVRSEFEAMIERPLRSTVDSLSDAVATAGRGPDDLTAVLLVGGSSRIPRVAQVLSETLGRPIAVDVDPKAAVSLGAAASAAAFLAPPSAPAPEEQPARPAPARTPVTSTPLRALRPKHQVATRVATLVGAGVLAVLVLTPVTPISGMFNAWLQANMEQGTATVAQAQPLERENESGGSSPGNGELRPAWPGLPGSSPGRSGGPAAASGSAVPSVAGTPGAPLPTQPGAPTAAAPSVAAVPTAGATTQPAAATRPTTGATTQPTRQPTNRPTAQPTTQPTRPTSPATTQPPANPTSQPTPTVTATTPTEPSDPPTPTTEPSSATTQPSQDPTSPGPDPLADPQPQVVTDPSQVADPTESAPAV